jgi:hypothetical protein
MQRKKNLSEKKNFRNWNQDQGIGIREILESFGRKNILSRLCSQPFGKSCSQKGSGSIKKVSITYVG